MNEVFLDTAGLIAAWDARDQWHVAATQALRRLRLERARFYTTSFVLAECANVFSRSPARRNVALLREKLEVEGWIVRPTEAEWNEAWVRYAAGHPGGPGLVDELSFAVMRRLGLARVFTCDRHFANAGFEVLF